jgi:hypothetical protein
MLFLSAPNITKLLMQIKKGLPLSRPQQSTSHEGRGLHGGQSHIPSKCHKLHDPQKRDRSGCVEKHQNVHTHGMAAHWVPNMAGPQGASCLVCSTNQAPNTLWLTCITRSHTLFGKLCPASTHMPVMIGAAFACEQGHVLLVSAAHCSFSSAIQPV